MGFIKDIITLVKNIVKLCYNVVLWVVKKFIKGVNSIINFIGKTSVSKQESNKFKMRIKERKNQFNEEIL